MRKIISMVLILVSMTWCQENWVKRNSGSWAYLHCATYGSGMIMVVGDSGTILTSSDGINWNKKKEAPRSYLYSVTYGCNQFVIATLEGAILATTNGNLIRETYRSATNKFSSAAYGNNLFVVVGYGGQIFTSSDLITWKAKGMYADRIKFVNYCGDRFMTCWPVMSSLNPDLIGRWESIITGVGTNPLSVCYGNNRFVIVYDDGEIASSADTKKWIVKSVGRPGEYNTITYGNNQFVAILRDTVYTSIDGYNWNKTNTAVPGTFSVNFCNNKFVAVGYNGAIFTSEASTKVVEPRRSIALNNTTINVRIRINGRTLPAGSRGVYISNHVKKIAF